MKTFLTASVCRWLAPTLLGLAAVVSTSAAPTVERTLQGDIAATTRSVRIDHRSGPVTIVGVDSGFGWTWTMRCTANTDTQAEAYVKASEIDVKETAGTLQLDLLMPERRDVSLARAIVRLFTWSRSEHFEVRSELELRLPHAVAVDLRNRFGTSKLSALSGPLNLDCQNGRVELEDLSGAVNATTSFAPLHAQRLGQARLNNRNGGIEVAQVAGELRAATSFATLQVRDVRGRAELKNQNGRIEAENVDGRVLAATSFAGLSVHGVKGDADLKNQNGGIEARDITGDVTAATSFADLRVSDVGGKASLRCQNGRIEAARVNDDLTAANSFAPLHAQEIRGRADLDSQNGEVIANGIDGDLRAQTSFARMELDATSKRIDAHNKNGSVHITARSPAVERIAASASFAPIDVRLAGNVQPLIRASTSFGKVRSDFPVLLADSAAADATFYAESGQPKLDLRGQNGDIRIESLASR